MFDGLPQGMNFNSITKSQLVKTKTKAIRSGLWFKSLRRIDRVLIDLTIRVAHKNVRSLILSRNLLTVMEKLHSLLESNFSRVVRELGYPLARKISLLAQEWGNPSAIQWSSNLSFMKFLAVMNINERRICKI